jgi:hypothetical protein
MPTYEFKKTGVMRTVSVDGTPLVFAEGTATRSLSGGEYSIQWFARGDNGNKFSLTVGVKKADPTREVKGTIGPTRKDDGSLWLEV